MILEAFGLGYDLSNVLNEFHSLLAGAHFSSCSNPMLKPRQSGRYCLKKI